MCCSVQVIASVTDNSLRVWEARHGGPQHTLCGHQADAYILESHPREPRILMSAGYDGRVLLWDVVSGCQFARCGWLFTQFSTSRTFKFSWHDLRCAIRVQAKLPHMG